MIPTIEQTARNALETIHGSASASAVQATIARARVAARGRPLIVADVWDAARRVGSRGARRTMPTTRPEPTRAEALAWGRRELARRDHARERASVLAWGERLLAQRRVVRPSIDPELAVRQAERERLVARLTGTHVVAPLAALGRGVDGALEVREPPGAHVAITPPPATTVRPALDAGLEARQRDREALVARLAGQTAIGPRVERDEGGRLVSVSPETLVARKAGAR